MSTSNAPECQLCLKKPKTIQVKRRLSRLKNCWYNCSCNTGKGTEDLHCTYICTKSLLTLESSGWFHGLYDLVNSTLHTCKVGASYVCSIISFSMSCSAHLQENLEGGRSFGIAVVLCKSDRSSTSRSIPVTTEYPRVGRSLHPRNVPSGKIAVRLISRDFEADLRHGEDPSLVKREDEFRGQDFEKQFACTFKDVPVTEGVFGKVVIDHIQPSGIPHTLFEFNLTIGKPLSPLPPNTNADCGLEKWSTLAFRELATKLQASDEDFWHKLAKGLGFTDHELKTLLNTAQDPFEEIVRAFQARGGSPEEFIQALQGVTPGVDYVIPYGGGVRQSCQRPWDWTGLDDTRDDEEVEERMIQTPVPLQFIHNQALCTSVPLTPPLTPRKRKSATTISPSKCRRLFSDDVTSGTRSPSHTAPSVFVFPDVGVHDPDDTVHRQCPDVLPSSVLWQVAAHVHQKWKALGRTLDVPETELMCIEHANRDLRECTYQVLLKWLDMFPQRTTYGSLYAALCDCGLNSVAQKYCTKIVQ